MIYDADDKDQFLEPGRYEFYYFGKKHVGYVYGDHAVIYLNGLKVDGVKMPNHLWRMFTMPQCESVFYAPFNSNKSKKVK